MRALLPALAVCATAAFFTGVARGQDTNRSTKVANQLVALINAGDYAGIQTNFNRQMAAALPLDKSTDFFAGLTRQYGKIQKLGEPQLVDGWTVFPATFEKGALNMQIALEGRRELVAGLMFKPQKKQALPTQVDRYAQAADQVMELVNAGNYAGLHAKFTMEMAAALPLDKAGEFFKDVKQQVGKFRKLGKPKLVGEGAVIVTECEKGSLDMQLALDGAGKISGLSFTPRAAQ